MTDGNYFQNFFDRLLKNKPNFTPTQSVCLAIKNAGGIFIKQRENEIFFQIPIGCKADDEEFLRNQSDILKREFSVLKVKRVLERMP